MLSNNLISKIVDRQFKIVGASLTFKTLPEDGIITVAKKKMLWWNYWKFENEEQWKKWREWGEEYLKQQGVDVQKMDYIDLRWGMSYKIKKESQLF